MQIIKDHLCHITISKMEDVKSHPNPTIHSGAVWWLVPRLVIPDEAVPVTGAPQLLGTGAPQLRGGGPWLPCSASAPWFADSC